MEEVLETKVTPEVEVKETDQVEVKEEVKKEVEPTKTEEKLSFEKEEFEQRLNNKFAEGAKKAEKTLIEELGVSSKEELVNLIKDAKELTDKYSQANNELSQLKAEKLVLKAGGTSDVAENVVALLKGKGQELTEENIKETLKIFRPNDIQRGFGTQPIQRTTTGNKKPIPKVF